MAVSRPLRICGAALAAALLHLASSTPSTSAPVGTLVLETEDRTVGQSVLESLFSTPDGSILPYPFPRVIDALKKQAGGENVRTALIPIGRSLQRFSADPDYFASPRIVVAATGDAGADAADLSVADRVFLGFQPASGIVEAISYNDEAGRFEFHVIENYDGSAPARIERADRETCAICHQGLAPIFPAALWSETNGNPAIAERLSALGDFFESVAVRQGIDGPDAIDQAVKRANLLPVVDFLWRKGCGPEPEGTACRRMLVEAALLFRLGGSRSVTVSDSAAAQWDSRVRDRWPVGIAIADPILPNRDPSIALASGAEPGDIVQAIGLFDPETPRQPVIVWQSDDGAKRIVRELSGVFTDADIQWLDARLTGAETVADTINANCTSDVIDRGGPAEIRFDCAAPDLSVSGHVAIREGLVQDGRIDRLRWQDTPGLARLSVSRSGVPAAENSAHLDLRESAVGLRARLADGRRVVQMTLEFGAPGTVNVAKITVADDTRPLSSALDTLAGDGWFAEKPFDRRAVLSALIATLGP